MHKDKPISDWRLARVMAKAQKKLPPEAFRRIIYMAEGALLLQESEKLNETKDTPEKPLGKF